MSTLVYVGANVGVSLWTLFDKFDSVYVFEPDPEMFSELKRRFNQFEWVTLINAACSDKKGTAKFYVTGNRVASGLGKSSEAFQKVYGSDASTLKEITVDTINLGKYLESEGVDFIDLYYSDCQGSDLTILKTMKKFIDNKKIGITWSESNRIIETLLDSQHRHKVAQRLGMLDKGSGTPRDIKFKSYDANGNVVATNM